MSEMWDPVVEDTLDREAATLAEAFDAEDYWEKRLENHWGPEAVGYIGLGAGYNRARYRVKAAVFRRTIMGLDLDPSRIKILDVGSGTGFAIEEWLALGASQITGSDFTAFSVTQLQQRYPELRFCRLDIGAPLLGELQLKGFDCVSALDVLYHITDDGAYRLALQNIGQLLKPGGYLFLADNFLHGPTQRERHVVSHSLETIEGWLGDAGLQIVKRVPQYVLMNCPVDSSNRWLHWWWHKLVGQVLKSECRGRWLGQTLVPLEISLTRIVREGPSTELALCRRLRDSS